MLPKALENASRDNSVWRQLCSQRWRGKWGFENRWQSAVRKLRRLQQAPDEPRDQRHYWMDAYSDQEAIAAGGTASPGTSSAG